MTFEKPIFIVGCTNSGTKCLMHSLLGHPQLGGLYHELHWYGLAPNIEGRLNRLFALYPCFNSSHLMEDHHLSFPDFATGPHLKKHAEQIITQALQNKTSKSKEGKRYLFKDPKFSLRTRWLKKLWPDAYIIAIVRNPWAVIEGIRRRLPILGDIPLNLDIPTATAQWNIVYNTLRLETKKMERVIWIRYEDMIAAPKFPDSTQSNCFWSHLLAHLDLPAEGFKIPNDSQYSKFKTDTNDSSIGNLSQWETEYITLACQTHINEFGYKLENLDKDKTP